ncbi:Histone-lysine N-methyltransferase ASH1L [Strongyloides ratti]|uniref:Histone-lysine N-methyltransferase ASH1L n=1 Tax=Strongyloides ratti TaxID=34506 RepID=A0A090MWL5_STRRB|nr:Histone-lysine N-methyltransferase ASH1L [Strongyloides ratti]CEF63894.1 Histone-lysine N-methyltransferase ASH1L [Strongyloides ratti]
MSYEAVPCKFKGRTEDGGEAEYVGLFIRPRNNVNTNFGTSNDQTPQNHQNGNYFTNIAPKPTNNNLPKIMPKKSNSTCNISNNSTSTINIQNSHNMIVQTCYLQNGGNILGSNISHGYRVVTPQSNFSCQNNINRGGGGGINDDIQQNFKEISCQNGINDSYISMLPSCSYQQTSNYLSPNINSTTTTTTTATTPQYVHSTVSPQHQTSNSNTGIITLKTEKYNETTSHQRISPSYTSSVSSSYSHHQTYDNNSYQNSNDHTITNTNHSKSNYVFEQQNDILSGAEGLPESSSSPNVVFINKNQGQLFCNQQSSININVSQHNPQYFNQNQQQSGQNWCNNPTTTTNNINNNNQQMSGTPDSGIQSIGGSPPSINAMTPPMKSPKNNVGIQYSKTVCDKIIKLDGKRKEDEDDFSDMPTLIPVTLDSHSESINYNIDDSMPKLPLDSPPILAKPDNKSLNNLGKKNRKGRKREPKINNTSPIISITPGMAPEKIVETLKSHLDSETFLQCSSLIQVEKNENIEKKRKENNDFNPMLTVGKKVTSQEIMEEFRRLKRNKLKENFDNMVPKMANDLEYLDFEITKPKYQSAYCNSPFQKIDLALWKKHENERLEKFKNFLHSLKKLRNEGTLPTSRRNTNTMKRPATSIGKNIKSKKIKKENDEIIGTPKIIKSQIQPSKISSSSSSSSSSKGMNGKSIISLKSIPTSPKTIASKNPPRSIASKPTPSRTGSKLVSSKVSSKMMKENNSSKLSAETFIKIRSNIIVNKPPLLPTPEECECDADIPCTSSRTCPSREKFMECTHVSCNLYYECENRRIQKNQQVHQLQHYKTENKGFGLRTHVDIEENEYVLEFTGEIITTNNYKERKVQGYGLQLQPGFIIDGGGKGSLARFLNHSCDPNCKIEKWNVNGSYRFAIFSIKKILIGEELTVDYSEYWIKRKEDTICKCESKKCKGIIPGVSIYQDLEKLTFKISKKEKNIVRSSNIFLIRNCRKMIRERKILEGRIPFADKKLNKIFDCFAQVMLEKEKFSILKINEIKKIVIDGMRDVRSNCAKTFNCIMKYAISKCIRNYLSEEKFNEIKEYYASAKRTNKYFNHTSLINTHTTGRKEKNGYITEFDLTYLNSKVQVGSYNPDLVIMKSQGEDSDCVRCICGIVEDEGEMIQCDNCYFWLHGDCLTGEVMNAKEFKCKFCKEKIKYTPQIDILLQNLPDFTIPGCTYYKTMINSNGLQLRINGTVYVKDDTVSSSNDKKYDRVDLRPFRIERIFTDKTGKKYFYGYYYARPHETFCDSSRLFFKNELLRTPFYRTVPVDLAVGRCLVLDLETYCLGRPIIPRYHEDDIYINEYQIDEKQRTFQKIPQKELYLINTQPYAFKKFPSKKVIKRNFTPFVAVNKTNHTNIDFEDNINVEEIFKNIRNTNINAILQKLH